MRKNSIEFFHIPFFVYHNYKVQQSKRYHSIIK